jgi:hypothetical protein
LLKEGADAADDDDDDDDNAGSLAQSKSWRNMLKMTDVKMIRPITPLAVFTARRIPTLFSLAFILLIAGAGFQAGAQSTVTGGFVGRVTERGSGAPVAGAVVTFTNQANNSQTARQTDADGNFLRTTLPPGDYRIRVTKEGFEDYEMFQTLFATRANSVIPLPIELVRRGTQAVATPTPTPTPAPTANVQAIVNRTGDETANFTPQRAGAFDERAVRTLPLGGATLTRSFDELAFLVPGVLPPPQAVGNSVGPGVGPGVGTSGQFSVNGLRSRANNFTVDGSDNNDEDIGVRRQGFFSLVPQPIESIQEFQIITLLAPAEFGRNLGAQVNALSKSGGNRFRGTLFGFGNADFLNARNFFDNAAGDRTVNLTAARRTDGVSIPVILADVASGQIQPLSVTNNAGEKDVYSLLQGGFAVGGPIVRNRLFFFASGEGQHQDGVRERHFAVPTVEERGLLGFGAEGLRGIGPNNTFYPVFPTNINGDAVFSLFPFPNDPNGIYGRNTYTKALSVDARGLILSGRVDYNLFKDSAARQQVLTARYNYTDDWRDLTDVGGAIFSAIRPKVRTDNFSTFLTGSLTDNLSNEFRFSWGRTRLRFDELRDDFLRPVTSLNASEDTRFLLNAPIILNNTRITCPNNQAPCANFVLPSAVTYIRSTVNTEDLSLGPVGQVIIGGFSPVGVDVFNFPQARQNDTFQFADTLRWQFSGAGQHSLAFGTDIRRVYLDSDLPRNSRPLVTFFGGNCFNVNTLCPATAGFAQPLDFAATGAATGFSQSLVAPGRDAAIKLSYNQLNFFAQDEWRAARNLTLNFGLRYELNTTPKEADDKIEQTFGQPLPAFLSGLGQFIDGRRRIYESDRDNFAPRFGFAYSPNSRTVLRGGVGVYYDQILGAVVSQSRNVFPTFRTANFGGGTFSNNSGVFTLFNPRYAVFDTNQPGRTLICNIANIVVGLPFGDCNLNNSQTLVQDGTLNTINPNLSAQQLNTILSFLNSIFPSGSLFEVTLPTRRLDAPLSYQYSIGVEQELLRNTFLSVAYVGTTGRDLLRFTSPNLGGNAVSRIDGFFFDDFNCVEEPNNPLFCRPLAAQGTTGVTPPFAPRRFPNAGVVNQFETTARSQYHSLQVELRGRLGNRLRYGANYVYGRAKDDVSDVFDLAGAFALPQNSVTFAGEYAPANFDVRHRFTYHFIYGTPELRDQNDFVRFLFGDWLVAGAGRFNTGQPFTVNTIYDRNQDGNLTDRLDNLQFITVNDDRRRPLTRTCDPNLGNCRAALAAFGADGSIPRNSFRAGNILELDLSLSKQFVFKETQSVQVRMDVFNFINRANFGVPVRILEAAGFGSAVDTVTPGRRIQFGLRYMF